MPIRETPSQDALFPNGIRVATGERLPGLQVGASRRIAPPADAARARPDAVERYGAVDAVDVRDLSSAGWGLILPSTVNADPIEKALDKLIKHRSAQARSLFRVFKGEQGPRPGESAPDWLARQGKGPGLDLVDPSNGVPFYLLIVGSPAEISTEFQYVLDIYWAVGRLHFDDLDAYERYANSVVDYETAESLPHRLKKAAVFATEHPLDPATGLFTQMVARPFSDPSGQPIGKQHGFRVDAKLGADATKAAWGKLLNTTEAGERAALLFSGTHGLAFEADDPRLPACQGALLCQDWQGGPPSSDDWFAAEDLSADAHIHGMIHVLFACYGGGWEKFDTFRDGPGGTASQIADAPGIARLPQAMLAHPKGGALAVIAHVDRAWSYSFKTPAGGTQAAGLREVLDRIMGGHRVGNATDRFNVRWAALSGPLLDAQRDFATGAIGATTLEHLWIARDDARNYVILGDPAVRLRVERMINA